MKRGHKGVETSGKSVTRLAQHLKLAGALAGHFAFPRGQCAHIAHLEREDGKAVYHHTGRLGVLGSRVRGGRKKREQPFIDGLDEVVPALVPFVDTTFDCGDMRVVDVAAARLVLESPQREVAKVLRGNHPYQSIGVIDRFGSGFGPDLQRAVVSGGHPGRFR